MLGCRGAACADRPDGLVRDHETLVAREHRDLTGEHGLGLTGLALGLGLADAGDHAETGREGGLRAPGRRLVGLAEVLAPLGMADDGALDPDLDEHARPRSRP